MKERGRGGPALHGIGLLFVALPTLPHLLVDVARSLHRFGVAFLRAARILLGGGRHPGNVPHQPRNS